MNEEAFRHRVSRIDELLAHRATIYPRRDEAYADLIREIHGLSDELLKDATNRSCRPTAEQLTKARRLATQPVFLCGPEKSGTTLLTQLLDGHPALLVMPGDSHYVGQRSRWRNRELRDIHRYWLQRLVNPSGQRPFWFQGPDRHSLESFLQHLDYFLSHTQYEVFVCVVLALFLSSSPDSGDTRFWVEKTPNNELHAEALLRAHPRAKFINIVRDPLTNIASLFKLAQLRQNVPKIQRYALSMRRLFTMAKRNEARLGRDRYLVLRYEDLTASPEATMRRVSDHLGLPYQKTLITPTEQGRPGVANSMFKDSRVRGKIQDQSQSQRYRDILSQADIRDIVRILGTVAADFGYTLNRDGNGGTPISWEPMLALAYPRATLEEALRYHAMQIPAIRAMRMN